MDKTNLILNSTIELVDVQEEGNGKGRPFVSRFLEPGIAHYKELGDILITKETLNKFIHTMVGCPVIIEHEDVTDENADKLRVGVVSRVWFNEMDGYFYCEGILTDPEAIDLVKNQGYNVSCAYSFVSDNTKRTHNGKEIDMEFIDGEFLHLALVKDPRYEGANIVVNSKTENENTEHAPAGTPQGGQFVSKDGETEKKADNRSFKNYTESLVKQAKISGIEDLKESKDGYQISFTIPQENYNARSKKLFEILKSSPKIEAYDDFNVTDKNNRKGIFIQFKKPSAENNIGDTIMSVLNDLTDFIKNVVSNEKGEEMKEVKNEDKRKLIDEIGGILKDKVDDEIIRTVIKKAEELSYEPSEDDKADNKAKNEDDEEEEAKNKCKNEEDKKEEDKKADNEDEEKDEKVTENEDEEDKEEKAENKKVKNSMKDIVMGGSSQVQTQKLYTSRKERLEEGNKY